MAIEFKDKLRTLMIEKNLTKTELSRRSRISRPTLDRYLKGGAPNRRMLQDLADGLGVAVSELKVPASKTAREMFEALGYEEVEVDSDDPRQYIRFTKSGGPVDINIDFDVKYKQISVYEFDCYYPDVHAYAVDIQELEAINRMVKELGWGYNEE